ncbi:MAG: type II secretion system F family protein [Patescibacteria group bacterium]
MIFKYKAIEQDGTARDGTIDAAGRDIAVAALQRRGLVVVSITDEDTRPFLERNLSFFEGVALKDLVVFSRQMSTLLEAQVSAVKTFRLLGAESENTNLRKIISQIADDVQSGISISSALNKHPGAFSAFYVNMVRAGEESGKLNEVFSHLADYLDRTYELNSKARNALIYPAFVVSTFIVVIILMLTLVIPKLSDILLESGQDVPFYTAVVIGLSNFIVDYGIFFLIVLALGGLYAIRFGRGEAGKKYFDELKISLPYIGDLYEKLYLSRFADNMDTMLTSGISMLRAIEITGLVVDNKVYEEILKNSGELVKGGSSLSDSLAKYPDEIPQIMIQMIRVGEETGKLGYVLKTLAKFYKREVEGAVDTLVSLIEPVLVLGLGLGVGFLLSSVLIPIYNIAGGI